MRCVKCGAMMPDNYKFCIKCGSKVEAPPQPQPQSQPQKQSVICSKCGAEVPENYKFCTRCGNKIEVVTQAQNNTQSAGRHFSLEDIARQQEEKHDIGFGSSVGKIAEESYDDETYDDESDEYADEYSQEEPPALDSSGSAKIGASFSPQPEPEKPAPANTPKKAERQSGDNVMLYKITSPAVPFGEQDQICIDIFGKDAAKKLADFKNR